MDPPSTARHQLLIYYADETSTQAAQSENYAALLSVLRSSSTPLAATVLAGIISDAEKFPLLVQRDIDALELQAKRLGFDLAIFTNALAFDGQLSPVSRRDGSRGNAGPAGDSAHVEHHSCDLAPLASRISCTPRSSR